MGPPGRCWFVEWEAAVRYDRPQDRRRHTRVVRSETECAAQIAAVGRWAETHTRLLGVWTAEPAWSTLDLEALPPALEARVEDLSPYPWLAEEAAG